ncbi:MAG: hypothetical protein FJ146_02135 [Deltaproteobacteria bacterium]|nr:hypothetical protein [Deltaproteobacteria bacterium]
MDRKSQPRERVVNLRAIGSQGRDNTKSEGPVQEIIGIALGFRVVFTNEAEVWTVRGITRDGSPSTEDIGELTFILLPGDVEPATAVTGFIAPPAPYVLAVPEEVMRQHIRGMVVQLGYDLDGFYVSLGVGGKAHFFEEFGRH